jgi:hypothetical protein
MRSTPTGFEALAATSNPAEDYANRQTEALQNPVQLDADLQFVIKAWDSLPHVVRHDIVALVKAVQTDGQAFPPWGP